MRHENVDSDTHSAAYAYSDTGTAAYADSEYGYNSNVKSALCTYPGLCEQQKYKEYAKRQSKTQKTIKKVLTGERISDNINKLSQGAVLRSEGQRKKIKKYLTSSAISDIIKKLAKNERDRKVMNIENFIV